MRHEIRGLRPWLAPLGLVLCAVVLLPPAGTAARHYVIAQALQFAVLAIVAPALIALGAPWRRLALAGGARWSGRLDRVTARRPRVTGGRVWLAVVAFIAVALAWRLPVAVNAMIRQPLVTVAEACTLLAAGCALWLELVESPPLQPRTSRPQRAAFAALPMWAIWASAYIMGFSGTSWFTAIAHPAGHGLSTIADQEIAAALLFAIPGACFVPVIYVSLMTWMRDADEPDEELRRAGGRPWSGPPRSPRGWRLPDA